MKPEWCPQGIWESAGNAIGGWTVDDGTNNQFWACQSSVAKALLQAEQRGKLNGMKQAADMMNARGAEEEEHQGLTREVQNYYRMRNAIRAKMEEFRQAEALNSTRS